MEDTEIDKIDTQPLPSLKRLIKATVSALVVALVLLFTAVLPAEYGVDPFGAGRLMGLTELGNTVQAASAQSSAGPIDNANAQTIGGTAMAGTPQGTAVLAVARADALFRSEERRLVLEPGRGIELKARMRQGEQFVFHWEADSGNLYVDMHGEEVNAGDDEFTNYWTEKEQSFAQGIFVAPFDGSHGWYWRNRQDYPIAVNVKISGFFEELYVP
jgi:hypothetical protein